MAKACGLARLSGLRVRWAPWAADLEPCRWSREVDVAARDHGGDRLVGDGGEEGPAREEGLEVSKQRLALSALGIGGDCGHVRGENNVVEGLEPIRNAGLALENVERRPRNRSRLQRLAQGELIDGDAAGDVDEMAARAKRGQNLPIDRAGVGCVGTHRHHQDVSPVGKVQERGMVGIGYIRARAAIVVGDLHLEGSAPRGDLGTDRSKAVYAEALAGKLRRPRRPLDDVPAPAAGAGVAVAADDAPHRGDHQTKREFGNRRGVGVAGVRNSDPSRPSRRPIDALIARAVTGDEPEFGQSVHQRSVGPDAARGDEGLCVLGRGRNGLRLGVLEGVQGVVLPEPPMKAGQNASGDKDRRFHCEPLHDTPRLLHCSTAAPDVQAG